MSDSKAFRAPSLRAYRRIMDFALGQAIKGTMSCREAKALMETAKGAAELYLAEKNMEVGGVRDQETPDHLLGADGGLETPAVPGLEDAPAVIAGRTIEISQEKREGQLARPEGYYETTAPEVGDEPEVVAEWVNGAEDLPVPRTAKFYPKTAKDQTYAKAPSFPDIEASDEDEPFLPAEL